MFFLTFADAGSVHHPDEGGAVLAVGGDTVLRGLEDVAVVFFHLQGGSTESAQLNHCLISNTLFQFTITIKTHNVSFLLPRLLAFTFRSLERDKCVTLCIY